MRSFLTALFCIAAMPAMAQLALPGATAPAAEGTVVPPSTKAPKPKRVAPRLPPSVAPAEASLAGKTLYLDGNGSQISFVSREKTVDVSRLLLKGTKISGSREVCQIELQGMPLTLSPLGRIDGLMRFSVPLPACPLSFEVLQGAVLMASDVPKCSFKEANCDVTPAGLWGPAPGEIGPDQVKTIERERERAESEVRNAYKTLVGSTKDRTLIKGIAGEQAGFSSHREEICRDYVGEPRHGLCATRLTQARATTLQSAAVAAEAAKDKRKKK